MAGVHAPLPPSFVAGVLTELTSHLLFILSSFRMPFPSSAWENYQRYPDETLPSPKSGRDLPGVHPEATAMGAVIGGWYSVTLSLA